MTKILCGACILFLSFLMVSDVYCQEDESSGGGSDGGFWSGLREMVRNFMNDFRKAWNNFTDELSARSKDMRGWTQEVFESFKQRMRDWVNNRDDISTNEKKDMRNYIERLEMPTEEQKNE